MGGRARRRHGDAPRRPSRTAVLLSGGTMLCSIASNFGQAPEPHQIVFGVLAVVGAVAAIAEGRGGVRQKKRSFHFAHHIATASYR